MPVTLAVITSTFPDEERFQAIGVWSGVTGAGRLLGMFASALLVDVATWRWLFALPLVLGAAALVLSARAVPDSRANRRAVRHGRGGPVARGRRRGRLRDPRGAGAGLERSSTGVSVAAAVAGLVASIAW